MAVVINAVTPLIGNALLDAGGAFTAVVNVPGAAVIGMSVDVSPETFPGEGVVWGGFVSGAGQVTVKVWRFTTGYVLGSVYNINVLTGSDAPAALELETNGTPNSSQTLLNLVAGTNVTLTDEGGGSIQIAASGGGGGGFSASVGPTGPIAMDGTDIVLATFSNVPPLAAGSTYHFKAAVYCSEIFTVKIQVDGNVISIPANAWPAAYVVLFETFYCNGAGVQNAQVIVPFVSWYIAQSSYSYGQETQNFLTESKSGGYPFSTTAIDWSTSHTVTVTMNAASGSGEIYFFRIAN
jgi:hypothetical protein